MDPKPLQTLMAKAELLTKLSTKKMMGKVKFPADAVDGTHLPLFQFFGRCTGLQSGESNFGPYTALLGDFVGVSADGTKAWRSGKAFLPQIATDLVISSAVENPGATINLAFDIGAKKNVDLVVGYEYTVKPLLPMAPEADPVLSLATSIYGGEAALPAPEKPAAEPEAPAAKPEAPETGKNKKK